VLVQTEVRHQLLELPMLVLKLLKPAQFAYAKTTIKLLPAEKRLLRNPHSAKHLSHRRARLRLLQRVGDLLFGILALLHGMLLQHKGQWQPAAL
jgi:hypothetical protein